jgi:hypothetical protein
MYFAKQGWEFECPKMVHCSKIVVVFFSHAARFVSVLLLRVAEDLVHVTAPVLLHNVDDQGIGDHDIHGVADGVSNYVKQGDSVTIVYGQQHQAIQSIQISSYLSDPTDAVKITAQFAKTPNGVNHAADVVVNGVSKQLTVEMQNSNYQLL